MLRSAVLALLLLAAPLMGQEPVKIPDVVKVTRGRLVPISLEGPVNKMAWGIYPSGQVDLIQVFSADPKVVKLCVLVPYDTDEMGNLLPSVAKEYTLVVSYGNGVQKQLECKVQVLGAAPRPVPPPTPPGPVIPPVPVPPVIPPDAPDAALVSKFSASLKADSADKKHAASLAATWQHGADLLNGAAPPATISDFYALVTKKSIDNLVPRRPYMENTRAVIEEIFGLHEATASIASLKDELSKKCRAVSSALKEAAK